MKIAPDLSLYDGRRYENGKWIYDLAMDWARARDDGRIDMAIVKSSEALFTDPAFLINWKGARGLLPRAAYHFFRANVNAIAQAHYMISLLESAGFDFATDYVILDGETWDGQKGEDILKAYGSFLYEIETWMIANGGHVPMIYTYPAFWKAIGGEKAYWAKHYPLALAQWPLDNWVASLPLPPYIFTGDLMADLLYKVQTGKLVPVKLAPWDKPAIWQFTSRGDSKLLPGHPGVKKVIDWNVIYMDLPAVSGEHVPDTEAADGLPGIPLPPPQVESTPEPGLYKVTALRLTVFAEPGRDAWARGVPQLKEGAAVNVLEFRTVNGETFGRTVDGWVRYAWLERAYPEEVIVGQYVVSSVTLKVFSGPNDTYRQVCKPLVLSQPVDVVETRKGKRDTWARLSNPAGWVRLEYLRKVQTGGA